MHFVSHSYVMDDVTNTAMLGRRKGINWGISQQLEEVDFADDICLLSHTFNIMGRILKYRKQKKNCWIIN
jgi:hypothetical protein